MKVRKELCEFIRCEQKKNPVNLHFGPIWGKGKEVNNNTKDHLGARERERERDRDRERRSTKKNNVNWYSLHLALPPLYNLTLFLKRNACE